MSALVHDQRGHDVTNITAEMIDTLNLRMRWLHQARTTGREPFGIKTGDKQMEAEKTASQQFADDYILVLENDREGWDEATQEARRVDYNMPALSDSIREQFEALVSQVLENSEEELTEFGGNVLRQILNGWGAGTFDKIAREIIARDKEALGIKTEQVA